MNGILLWVQECMNQQIPCSIQVIDISHVYKRNIPIHITLNTFIFVSVPSRKIVSSCPDCPTSVRNISPSIKAKAEQMVATFNQESNQTNLFKLDDIERVSTQVTESQNASRDKVMYFCIVIMMCAQYLLYMAFTVLSQELSRYTRTNKTKLYREKRYDILYIHNAECTPALLQQY